MVATSRRVKDVPTNELFWDQLRTLTFIEIECLSLLASGKEEAEIAEAMGLFHDEIPQMLETIKEKLGCEYLLQAVILMLRHGLVSTEVQ